MENKLRNSFCFFRSYAEVAQGLDGLARLEFIESVIEFALNGTEPRFSDRMAKALFAGIRPNLSSGWSHYKAGCRGGAPKGNLNAVKGVQKQPKNNQKTTKIQAIEKEREIENEIENESVPPTREKVFDFFTKDLKANTEDAEKFFSYYEAREWCLSGGQKMANWEAAARLWVARNSQFEKGAEVSKIDLSQIDHSQDNDM